MHSPQRFPADRPGNISSMNSPGPSDRPGRAAIFGSCGDFDSSLDKAWPHLSEAPSTISVRCILASRQPPMYQGGARAACAALTMARGEGLFHDPPGLPGPSSMQRMGCHHARRIGSTAVAHHVPAPQPRMHPCRARATRCGRLMGTTIAEHAALDPSFQQHQAA